MGSDRQADEVVLWLPREDEHELALEFGLCEWERDDAEDLLRGAQRAIASDLPGTRVIIKRWHIWRVVRAMVRLGVGNTPDGRAAAYVWLLGRNDTDG